MSVTVEFDDSLGIAVELWAVLEQLCPLDVTRHFRFVLPSLSNLFLLRSELSDVCFDFFAEEDLLQVDKRSVFEGELFVFEYLVEIRSQFRPLELLETNGFLRFLGRIGVAKGAGECISISFLCLGIL